MEENKDWKYQKIQQAEIRKVLMQDMIWQNPGYIGYFDPWNDLDKTGIKQVLSLMQTAAWDFHLLESTPQAEAHMHCIRAS